MPTETISVRTVQKGITYWREEEFPDSPRFTEDIAHPGRIDGRWGPRTHEALRDYVVFNRPGRLDAARVLAPLRSTPARATEIELELAFVARLNTHALLYRPGRGRQGTGSREGTGARTPAPSRQSPAQQDILPTRTRTPSSTRGSSSAGPLLGGLAIAGAVALLAAVMVSRSRAAKRQRFEEDDDFDDEQDEFFDDELVPA